MFLAKQIFNLLAPVVRRSSLVFVLAVISTSVSGIYTYTRTLTPERAYAATSSNLNFQARLLTASGNTVPDGYYNIEFKLYSVSSGGSALWTETYYDSNGVTAGNDNRLRVVNGYFSANLGSLTALPNIDWSQDLWLSMNVGGSTQTATPTYDGEMSPRVKLTAVPYALAAGNVRSANTSTASTNSDGVNVTTGTASGTTSNTGTINLQTGNSATSGNTGAITLTTGNATSGNSGSISLDVGTASGAAGTISVGVANTSGITIGRVGVATTNAGNLTVGSSAGSGVQFTNNGSTLNATLAVGNDSDGGALGGTPGSPLTAAQSVDIYTSIAINQTTAGQDIALPNPASATAGRILYVLNVGSTSFTMHSVTIPAGYGQLFIWNGSAWKLAASGGGAAITLQAGYDGGNTISSSNGRDFSFTSTNTATDANFIFNAATGSTGAFKVQDNGTDVLSIGAAGQLALSVQGNTGGLVIGGDAALYRSDSDTLRTESFKVGNTLYTLRGSDYSTTGSLNNFDFGSASLVRLTGASTQTVTGILNGTDGRILTIINAAAQTAYIADNSGSSSAGNQIRTGTGGNLAIPAGSSITLIYDAGANYWRVVGSAATASSGAGAPFVQGGNSFGADAELGTNDSYKLIFRTNNTDKAQLTTAGDLEFLQASTIQTNSGALTVDSAAALNLGTVDATSVLISRTGVATTVNGSLNVVQDFSVNTSNFVVTASNGNTDIAGTLKVGTSDAFQVNASGYFQTTGTGYINTNSTTAFKVEQSGVNNNTFVVDTTNGMVGVGTSTPGNLLSIGTLTTAVGASATRVAIATGSDTSSGLIIQNNSGSQSANPFMIQNSAGSPVAIITAGGSIISSSNFKTFDTTAAASNSSQLNLASGNATGAGSNSGNVFIDSGSSSSGTKGSITIGTITTPSVSLQASTGINIGTVGSATSSSTVHIADTSNATGTQAVTIGSAANTNNAVTIQAGATGAINFVGNTNVSASGSLATKKGADYSTTGVSSDVDFGGASLIRLTGASAQTINSILAGRDGQILTLVNAASQNATLKNNTGATAGNRIITGTGADLTLQSGGSITLIYDSGASRWRVIGSVATNATGTGAYILQGGNTFGTAANIGTNDNFNLIFRTNNTDKAQLTTAGDLEFLQASTIQTNSGALTVDSAAALNLGTVDATSVLISRTGVATTVNGSLNVVQDFSVNTSNFVVTASNGNTDIAGTLKVGTSDAFQVSATGQLTSSQTGKTAISLTDTTTTTGITIGGDTNLYRSVADELKTDDALTVTQLLTGQLGATISGATINLNASSNFATNINTGTSTGAVSIGNSAAGAISLQSGSSVDVATSSAVATTITLGSTTQTGTITVGQSTASNTINIGNANTATGNTQTINIGAGTPTGTGKAVVTIGNTNDASSVTIKAGTGNINLNPSGTSNTGVVVKPGTNSTAAFQIQNATNASILTADTATTPNLITNGDIEGGTTTGWTAKGTATLTQSSSHQWQGNNSLSVAASTGSDDGAKYNYTFTASTQYTLSLYAKVGSGTITDINIGRQDNGSDIDCLSGQTLTTSWTRFTCTFTTGGTISGSFIYINKTGGSSETFFIDGIQLQTGASATSFNSGGALQFGGVVNSPISFQNKQDSTTAFQIQNAAGTTLLAADTINQEFSIASATTAGSGRAALKITNTVDKSGIIVQSSDGISNGEPLFLAVGDAVDDKAFQTKLNGNAFGRFNLNIDGTMSWGSGSASRDTNLYRGTGNALRTDDQIQLSNNSTSCSAYATGGAESCIWFGNDTNLYRSAADVLQTDDQFQSSRTNGTDVGLSVKRSTDSNARMVVTADGAIVWDDGASAVDEISLYRSQANELSLLNAELKMGRSAATATALSTSYSGNTIPAFVLRADGRQTWGDGTVWDTNLYRGGSSILVTDDTFIATADAVAGIAALNGFHATDGTKLLLGGLVDSEAQYRFRASLSGKLEWGTGLLAPDTNLYRSTADILQTDDAFVIGGAAGTNSATKLSVQNTAGTSIFNVDTTNAKIGTADSTTTSTAALTIKSGNASVGSNLSSGNVVIDSGTATGTGTTGSISLGTTNSTSISIGNTTAATATNIQGGTTGGINIGTVGSATTGSTIHIADTSNGTGVQNVVMGSTANVANTTILQAGSTNGVRVRADGANAFQIQNASGGTTIFKADVANTRITIGAGAGTLTDRNLDVAVAEVTSKVRIGTSNDGISFNDTASTNGLANKLRFSGSARNTKTVTLIPEYAGAVMTGDGLSNTGTMTSDFCSNSSPAINNGSTQGCANSGERHNYYSWTSQATNDYDIYVRYQLPSDFDGWASNTAIQMYGWAQNNSTDSVQLSVYNSSGGQCGSTTTLNTSNTTWQLKDLTGSESTDTNCNTTNMAPGSTILFVVHVTVGTNGNYVRAGEISMDYLSKF